MRILPLLGTAMKHCSKAPILTDGVAAGLGAQVVVDEPRPTLQIFPVGSFFGDTRE